MDASSVVNVQIPCCTAWQLQTVVVNVFPNSLSPSRDFMFRWP